MCEELRSLKTQADAQLREETSRRCSLLQEEVQGAALNMQQLLLKLQQAEDKVRVRPVTRFFFSRPELSSHKTKMFHCVQATECREAAAGEGPAPSSWQTLLTQRGHPAATD